MTTTISCHDLMTEQGNRLSAALSVRINASRSSRNSMSMPPYRARALAVSMVYLP